MQCAILARDAIAIVETNQRTSVSGIVRTSAAEARLRSSDVVVMAKIAATVFSYRNRGGPVIPGYSEISYFSLLSGLVRAGNVDYTNTPRSSSNTIDQLYS
jgi:hypothetical protein